MLVLEHTEALDGDRSRLAVHLYAHDDHPADDGPRGHDPPLAVVVDMRAPYLQEASH